LTRQVIRSDAELEVLIQDRQLGRHLLFSSAQIQASNIIFAEWLEISQ
jgi:hypothetical protein